MRDEHDLADCVNDAGHSCACKQCDEQAENPLFFLSAFGVEQAGVGSLLNGALYWFHSTLRFCAAFFDWLLGVMLPACRTWFGVERWFRPQRGLLLGIRRMPRLEMMHFDLLAAFDETNRH